MSHSIPLHPSNPPLPCPFQSLSLRNFLPSLHSIIPISPYSFPSPLLLPSLSFLLPSNLSSILPRFSLTIFNPFHTLPFSSYLTLISVPFYPFHSSFNHRSFPPHALIHFPPHLYPLPSLFHLSKTPFLSFLILFISSIPPLLPSSKETLNIHISSS